MTMYCLLFTFLLLASGMMQYGEASDECGCNVLHPQQAFCNSDWAMLVSIESGDESPLPFEEVGERASHYKYNVTVRDIYMPEDTSIEDGESIFLYTPNTWCGETRLDYMEEYVISGSMVEVTDPDSGQSYTILMMTKCGISMRFNDVTEIQMKGLTTNYKQYCEQCPIRGIRGELRLGNNGPSSLGVNRDSASQYWSLNQGCMYNPAASAHNIVKDCETEFSYCRFDENLRDGQCGWDTNPEFMGCFRKRSYTVSYRLNPNRAAVRRASDCVHIQNRRMRKTCVMRVRRTKIAARKQARLDEIKAQG